MRRLFLFLFIFRNAHCSCPAGYELVRDGECRGFRATMNISLDEDGSHQIASSKCKEIEGLPVIIHNEEQQSYWARQARKERPYLLLGLECDSFSKAWKWADGSALDFKPKNYSEGLTRSCGDEYVWVIVGDGAWSYESGLTDAFDVFCTTQLHQPSGDGCGSFEDDIEDGNCYQNWTDAQTTCQNMGASTVASIHNLQQNSFIRHSAAVNGAVNGMYIGAASSGEGEHYGWIDRSAWEYENFSPVLLHCAQGFCRGELVRNGECRDRYHVFAEKMTWAEFSRSDQEQMVCHEMQGKPMIIHDGEQQSWWSTPDPYQMDNTGFLALSLRCNANTMRWEWIDGSKVDFKPPTGSYDQELDQNCKEGCAWSIDQGNGTWSIHCDDKEEVDIFVGCTQQLAQPTRCEMLQQDNGTDVCYVIGTCVRENGHPASVHNTQENSFIRRLAVSTGAVNGIFLGAAVNQAGSFEWSDRSNWDYNNFYPGYPKNESGDCLAMDTQSTSGQWVNADCYDKDLPSACISEPQPIYNCTSGPWEVEEWMYSPGYPFDASIPCDYLLTVPVDHTIQLEIHELEANSCCDKLTIYDSIDGGNLYRELTGSLSFVSYSIDSTSARVSWRPNGGVNVRGVMMKFHAYKVFGNA